MIQLIKINKKYQKEVVLSNVNIKITSPCFICINGPSGSGKSTLLNIISLFDVDFEGEYFLFSKNVKTLSKQEKESILQHNITYLFQEDKFIDDETIETNLKLYSKEKYSKEKALELISRFDLKVELNKQVSFLSKGEKKRLMLIASLLKESNVLILDEITSGLDIVSSKLVLETLKEISKDKIVILVTHEVDLIKNYCKKIYYLKNKSLNIITKGKKKIVKVKKYNSKLNLLYLYNHAKRKLHIKKQRFLCVLLCGFISLFTMGLSILLSTSLSKSMISSFEDYFNSNQVVMKKNVINDNFNFEVVDDNEFEDFYFDYEDLILETKNFYLANYESYFYSNNSVKVRNDNQYLSLDNYSIRNINESLPLSLNFNRTYPTNIDLRDDQVVISLSEKNIYDLCKLLKLESNKYDALSKYFLNDSLDLIFEIANDEWEYYLTIDLEVVGFVISNTPCIYALKSSFTQDVIEDNMKLPTSYFPFQIDYYPWVVKKYPTLVIDKLYTSTFYKKFLLDEKMNQYSFHLIEEKDIYYLNEDHSTYDFIYLSYKNKDSLSINEIEQISNEDQNITSYIPCSSSSFSVDEQSLLNGFSKPIYLSNRLNVIEEFVEYNSFSQLNMGNYQSSLFDIQSKHLFSLSLLDCAKDNFVSFVPLNKKEDKLLIGDYPENDFDIVISSELYSCLNLDYLGEIYLTSLMGIKDLNNKYYNEFKTIKLNVVGVIKSNNLAIYQDSLFPLLLTSIKFNHFSPDLEISKCLLTLKESNKEIISNLNLIYPKYIFTSPLQEYKKSIDQGISYFSLGLLIFSLISMILTILMMILVNYLFIQESEKEIAVYMLLGYQKNSIFNYFIMINLIIVVMEFIISSIGLTMINLVLPYLNVGIEESYFSLTPYFCIIISLVFSLIINLAISARMFLKKNIICLIKEI